MILSLVTTLAVALTAQTASAAEAMVTDRHAPCKTCCAAHCRPDRCRHECRCFPHAVKVVTVARPATHVVVTRPAPKPKPKPAAKPKKAPKPRPGHGRK